MATSIDTALAEHYSEGFYTDQIEGSLRSARIFAAHIFPFLEPGSVVDVGCGRGTWLKAFGERGARRLSGFDGPWNSQDKMLDRSISFASIDLRKFADLPPVERFDLAMSLEVAEHIEEECAASFISGLTQLADVILFGAAYLAQGGANHINEKPHSYWARFFAEHDFLPFDLLRPRMWGNREVEFWYAQNTFLYVKAGSAAFDKLKYAGLSPVGDISFLDAIHPTLYQIKLQEIESLRKSLSHAVESLKQIRQPKQAVKNAAKSILPTPVVSMIKRAID